MYLLQLTININVAIEKSICLALLWEIKHTYKNMEREYGKKQNEKNIKKPFNNAPVKSSSKTIIPQSF